LSAYSMPMLNGQPIVTYRANWVLVSFFLIVTAGFGWLFVSLLQPDRPNGFIIQAMVALFAVMFLSAAVYVSQLVVCVFVDGISVKTIGSESQMRWDQVDTLYYSAVQQRVYGIPVNTSYTLRMEDRSGNKLKIPSGLGKGRELANLVVRNTTPLIMKNLQQRFVGGERIAFGSIQISLTEGIDAKANAFKKVKTPWEMFAGTQMKSGMLYILRQDKTNGGIAAISSLPNAFALQTLLAQVQKSGSTASADQQVRAASI
jgi:hypothetical protein